MNDFNILQTTLDNAKILYNKIRHQAELENLLWFEPSVDVLPDKRIHIEWYRGEDDSLKRLRLTVSHNESTTMEYWQYIAEDKATYESEAVVTSDFPLMYGYQWLFEP